MRNIVRQRRIRNITAYWLNADFEIDFFRKGFNGGHKIRIRGWIFRIGQENDAAGQIIGQIIG